MDANDLLMGRGSKSVNWKDNPVGYTVIGTITTTPKVEQMTKFQSTELDFWPSGDPKMQIVVTLQTEMRDPANADDDGLRKLHIQPRMMVPVREAIQRAGAKGLEIGGRLAVRRIGGTGATGDPFTFAAEYGAPTVDPGSLLGGGQAAPATQAAPMLAQAVQPTYTPSSVVPGASNQQPAPSAAASLGITQPAAVAIPCPPGMDPAKWAALPEPQQRAIAAAMAQPANQPTPF